MILIMSSQYDPKENPRKRKENAFDLNVTSSTSVRTAGDCKVGAHTLMS